jgi:hypothetical protein
VSPNRLGGGVWCDRERERARRFLQVTSTWYAAAEWRIKAARTNEEKGKKYGHVVLSNACWCLCMDDGWGPWAKRASWGGEELLNRNKFAIVVLYVGYTE